MANQPNSDGWDGWDPIRRDRYRAQQDQTTGKWVYTWESESRTPRSASNENPLATQATQSSQLINNGANPEQTRYSSGADGDVYRTDRTEEITNGVANMTPNLGEPQQTRRRRSDQVYASGRNVETRPAVTDRTSRPSGGQQGQYPARGSVVTHIVQPNYPNGRFGSRRASDSQSFRPQYLASHGGYGRSQATYEASAKAPQQLPVMPLADYRDYQSILPASPLEQGGAGKQTQDYYGLSTQLSMQQLPNGYAAGPIQNGASYTYQYDTTRSSLEPQTSSAYPAPRMLASPSAAPISDGAASPYIPGLGYYQDQFKRVMHKPQKFFVVGKVFMMYHVDNAGDKIDRSGRSAKDFTTISLGEVAHHTFRRFIVVEECSREHFCHCLAITTYGGQGVTKPGVVQSSHTMIYTGKYPPSKLPGEEGMKKEPLQMTPTSLEHKLDPISRVNLRKHYPIEHNWKVLEIGQIAGKSLPKLLGYSRSTKGS